MPRRPTFRQLLVSILALWRDRSYKEIGAAAGIPQRRVSAYLRRGEIADDVLDKLLAAVECSPSAVLSVSTCLESLESLESETDLTEEEKAEIADALLRVSRPILAGLAKAARRSRISATEGSPHAQAAAYDRQRADELLGRLETLPRESRLAVIQIAEEFWSWALCERVCDISEREASRDVERAEAWATLARQIAERVRGPEEWRRRIQGYAAAHGANVLRVSGDLASAETAFEEAKLSWCAGSDPAGVLDPGRLLDLEASLRRDQRRLPEALALLDEAAAVGRHPERALIKKGSTLEVMGQYEAAVDALLRTVPILQRKGDARLEAMLNCNLALNYCQLGRFAEAAELADSAAAAALETGDVIGALRVTWTQGRIAAGLGQSGEARDLLAQARREFVARGMDYDAALALLEESALLLDLGLTTEVKRTSRELAVLFDSKGVHREALVALRLFREAAEQDVATAELARQVLRYLFRARHDPGLRFTS
jgi:tetratricopeptide (TPR) repeat protein